VQPGQPAPPAAGMEQPPPPATAVVQPDQPAPPAAAVEPSPALPIAGEPVPIAEPRRMFRIGANGAPMLFFPGPSVGINGSVRIGARFTRIWGAHLDLGGGFGFAVGGSEDDDGASLSVSAAIYVRVAAMAELILGNRFLFSLGPALFSGGWGYVESAVNNAGESETYSVSAGGTLPAILARFVYAIGDPLQRGRFTIGLEAMLVFGSVDEVTLSSTSAGIDEAVSTGDFAFAFSPAIVVGWEFL